MLCCAALPPCAVMCSAGWAAGPCFVVCFVACNYLIINLFVAAVYVSFVTDINVSQVCCPVLSCAVSL